MFEKHITRFLSLILMVLISVGFIAGVGSAADRIYISMSDYYEAQNVSDFIAKSTADSGFTPEQVQAVKDMSVFSCVETGASIDIYLTEEDKTNETPTRLYFLDSLNDGMDADNITVNTPTVKTVFDNTEDAENPVACETGDNKIESFSEPETITLDFVDILDQLAKQAGDEPFAEAAGLDENYKAILNILMSPVTVTVTEVWSSPLTFAMDGEPSYLNSEDTPTPSTVNEVNALIDLKNVLYIPSNLIPEISISGLTIQDIMSMRQYLTDDLSMDSFSDGPVLGTMDMYVTLKDRAKFDAFSGSYDKEITAEKEALTAALGSDMQLLTLYENYSFLALKDYADDVLYIGYLLMVVFLLVTVLVVLSTMSRLVEEERSQIACLKTLGYSSTRIIMKYVLFALIAMIVGAIVGYFVVVSDYTLIY